MKVRWSAGILACGCVVAAMLVASLARAEVVPTAVDWPRAARYFGCALGLATGAIGALGGVLFGCIMLLLMDP